MGDEDIIITIDPDELSDDGGAPGAGGDKTKQIATTEEPIADLKAQFATLQSTAETATQRATAAETEAQRAARERDELAARNKDLETEVTDSRKSTIDQGLTAAEGQLKSAKDAYKRAFADGDADAAAEAQVQIAEATSTIGRLKEAKADLADTKPAPRKTEPRAPVADPTEAFIQTRSVPAQTWLRANREWLDNGPKNAKLTAAHYSAIGDGIAVDTPQYFEHIEKSLGIKTGGGKEPKLLQRRPTAPAAPGADAGGRTASPIQVTLTKGEAAAATDGTHVWNYDDPTGKGRWKKGEPIGTAEFARRKVAMQKQGLYDRTYSES